MRNLLIVFFLLLSASSFLEAAWTLRQSKGLDESPTASSIAVTMDSAFQAKDLVLVYVKTSYDSTGITSCGDPTNGAYTAIAHDWIGAYGSYIEVYYFQNSAAVATPTVTCSFETPTPERSLYVSVFGGGATSSVLDQSSVQTQATATTSTDGMTLSSVTTTSSNELVVGWVGIVATWPTAMSAGTGFTWGNTYVDEYKVVASAGAATPTFTVDATSIYHGITVAFKIESAAARRRQVVIE